MDITLRYSIRFLLLLASIVAVVCMLIAAGRNFYYHDRLKIRGLLADVENIRDISLDGFDDDVCEEIVTTSFSIADRPGSLVRLRRLEKYHRTGEMRLEQIGPWRFVVGGRRHIGAVDAATGEPAESDYALMSLRIGANSPYSEFFPCDVATLDGIVQNYDDLVALFATWPTQENPGRVTLGDGTEQFFYVIRDESNTTRDPSLRHIRDNINALD